MQFNLTQQIDEECRYDHERCGDTRQRLYVKRSSTGWLYHCFNCGWSGYKKAKQYNTLTETKEYLSGRQNQDVSTNPSSTTLQLPYDCVSELPHLATHWLDRYDITPDEAQRYHFKYSPKLRRLILPLYNSKGELIYWQGRTLTKPTKENPKYMNVSVKKDEYAILNPKCETVILVEDILSAIKVARLTSSIPILGSYIGNTLLKYVKEYAKIYIWLDMDKRFESLKYSQRVRLLTGRTCSTIITEKDPKEYSEEEMRVYIKC